MHNQTGGKYFWTILIDEDNFASHYKLRNQQCSHLPWTPEGLFWYVVLWVLPSLGVPTPKVCIPLYIGVSFFFIKDIQGQVFQWCLGTSWYRQAACVIFQDHLGRLES